VFVGGTDPGEWRPTTSYLPGPPPSGAPMAGAWLPTVTPFTLNSPTQFRAVKPPVLTSARYFHEYEEVRALGAFEGSTRSPTETDFAYFFATAYLVNWNQVAREVAGTRVHHIADSARLFALLGLSLADAVITAWDSKLYYNLWRPVTAIQEGDNDGNAKTVGDPNWTPLINTPNYPAYISGASTVTGAATRALARFFGSDHVPFTFRTTNAVATQRARDYSRFSDAAADVVLARILEGIHFRSDDVVGVQQGRHIATWVFNHFLRPVNDSGVSDESLDDSEEDEQ
jgi:hypothetical protein